MQRLGILLLVFVLAGCGGDSKDDDLVVSAASSLKGAFTELGGARYSFAGSDQLAAQIRQGVKVDVFASANTSLPDELFEEGLVEKPVVFAGNSLVLAVPTDSDVQSVDDLAGKTLAIGAADVPVGKYTREYLARIGREDVLKGVRSEEPDVKGVVGKLTQGAVDAGFVYATDIVDGVRAIELEDAEVQYGVAVVKDAPHAEAAEAFVESLREGDGRDALEQAGFTIP